MDEKSILGNGFISPNGYAILSRNNAYDNLHRL